MSRRISAVKAKGLHEEEIMSIVGVTGLAVGKEGGRPCIIVYVRKAKPGVLKAIPREIEGFPVKVEESGDFVAL